jgi:nicotinamide-nucleotide amidase
MKAEILATGDEIRSGALVDTNSAYIAEKLEETGIAVQRHNCAGDDATVLEAVIQEISGRADICVVTGGLGPTTDDITAEAAAAAAGKDLVEDEKALSMIAAFFAARNREMTASNRKQALVPRGSKTLYNPVGTAPGFSLKIKRCTFFFLPGVPPEMVRMLSADVLPGIEEIMGTQRSNCLVRNISTFGLTESAVGEKVAEVVDRFPGLRLGLRAKFPEIHVKFYLNGKDLLKMQATLDAATEWVKERVGKYVLSTEGEAMPRVVGRLLKERGATLAVAESCTGGRIANWLTDVPGSSDYFLFAGVSYANAAKVDILGVSTQTLDDYGAVSEETAREMAGGARRIANATYGISTTGIAGPGGGTDEKPVGTVCIGLATPDKAQGKRFFFPFGKRSMNKSIFAMMALEMLRREMLNI